MQINLQFHHVVAHPLAGMFDDWYIGID